MPAFDKQTLARILSALSPEASPHLAADVPRITVHAAISHFAVLYERIRNAVDYRDDHLLRRAAIKRIVSRHLLLEPDSQVVAEQLVRELIGARYLPNGELPETLYAAIALCIQKYRAIENARVGSGGHMRWLRALIVVEIEEILVNALQQKMLAAFLYDRLCGRIKVTGMPMSDTEVRMQTFLACHRIFLKADDEWLAYMLLPVYVQDWFRPADWLEAPQSMAERLVVAERRIQACLAHPLALKFQRAVKPWAVALSILRDVLTEKQMDPRALLDHQEDLRRNVARVSERHHRVAKGRLRSGSFRAIIYLFFTKMLLALLLEIPLERLLYSKIAFPALAVNLLFPPLLMFFIGLFISVPHKDNTSRLQSAVESLLSSEPLPPCEIRVSKKRSVVGGLLFGLMYAILFALVFGTVSFVLFVLRFTWISTTIFLFFLCMVSFFAFRLRRAAREMVIVESREGLRSAVLDMLSIPVLRVGRLLSRSISRLNVFLFFFDVLFEAPFKLLLASFEDWLTYLREKKEELS